ncbi:MAG: hypothetical protein HY540_02000 [Deltaproteobacteria bacterium]|nr:hypothetical protein [Deltaproteobacteria bacterium]
MMNHPPIIETTAGALYPEAIDLDLVRKAHVPFAEESKIIEADGNTAAAYACLQMWRCMLFAGFPITPSTKWLETVAAVIRSGKVGTKKKLKLLEAEHAVADYLAGASAACRDLIFTTATSSVGLDHMTESTRSLGGSGLGNAMLVNVYRATANYPLCIEGDPSDALAHRDDGWIQFCCRGVQQIYDTVIQLPCLGMHPEVMTPTMPGYYGIKDSHRSSRLVLEADADVNTFQDRWIAPAKLPGLINGDTALGNCVTSQYFQGFKVDQRRRILRAFDLLSVIGADFEKTFGRPGLECIEKIRWPENEEAVDLAIVGMGPDMGTAAALADQWETSIHKRIGVLAARLIHPFPSHEYARILKDAKAILVLNQAHHSGPGHLSVDLAEACYDLQDPPKIISAFAGMGGAALTAETWQVMIDYATHAMKVPTRRVSPIVVHEGKIIWQKS